MKNIYFFQVNFPIGFGRFQTHWLPYAVARLWSYAKTDPWIAANYTAKDFIFERLPVEEFVQSIDTIDIAAFSSYIWNENYNLRLAKAIKERFPNCTIVFGGPQVPDRADDYLLKHTFIDHVFHGESEYNFADFLLGKNTSKSIVGNRIDDLNTIVSPFLNGVMDAVVAKHPNKNFSVTLETNRGCPYACTFCDWGSLTYSKVKKFSTDIVKAEIEWISRNGIKFVDVADANFGIFKERDFDILRHMIEYKDKYGYPETYSFNWQKNSTEQTLEMVKYLTDNNSARGMTLSVQSMSNDVLENIKRKNMEVSNYEKILQECNVKNIQTYTELILGLPGETYESWVEGVDKLLTTGQHNNIEVWLCQMLVNAELSSAVSKERHGIETALIKNYISGDTQDLEGIEVVKSTRTLSYEQLLECYMYSWMITNFHSFGWTQIISRWLYVTHGVSYREFYDKLFSELKTHKYYDEVKSNVHDAFETGIVQEKGMHYYIAEFQKKLHMDRAATMEFVKTFAAHNYDVPQDVFDFTDCFITDYNKQETVTKQFDIPVWTAINSIEPKYTYTFDITQRVDTEKEYYDSFYFRRRKGWGKCTVTS
jgi:putative methyltransferase